jgi:hypothetical protein
MRIKKSTLIRLVEEELSRMLNEDKGDVWHVPDDWVGKTRSDERDMNKHVRGNIWYKAGGSSARSSDGKVEIYWMAAYDMISITGEAAATGKVLFEITAVKK